MRIELATDEGPRDRILAPGQPDATVADLLATIGSPAAGMLVEGRFVPGDHALDECGLFDGARVEAADGPIVDVAAHVGPWLCVTGGLDAGTWWPVRPGVTTVGRDATCDVRLDSLTVSGLHAEVALAADGTIEIADVGSRNGTWIDGTAVRGAVRLEPGQQVRAGAVTLELVRRRPADRPDGADRRHGPWAFNRPPRPALPAPPEPLAVPQPPRDVPTPAGFGWASLLTPIVMAVAMVLVFDNLMFALFAVISPLTILGSWWESRRRTRGEADREATRSSEELARFEHEVRAAVQVERARRRQAAPHLAEVTRRVEGPSVRLWERRTPHDDAFVVGVGAADVTYRPPLASQTTPADAAREILERHAVLHRTPVAVDLADGGVVGVVGPRAAAVAVARAVVLQLAVHHGPADLELSILTTDERHADWAWAGWLPHARDPRDRDLDRIVSGLDAATALTETWLSSPQQAGPVRCVVADADGLTEGRRAPVRNVLNGAAGPVVGVVVAASADRLPASCRHVVELRDEDGTAVVRTPGAGAVVEDVMGWGTSAATARASARRLARFEDAEALDEAASLPRAVPLPGLLELDPFDPDAVLGAWRAAADDPGLRVPVGVGPDGPVWLDLVRDGPHALIGGTTGSGKSELLRSLVAGLAARVGPTHLNIVLIDYKGGSAFDVCADLPHTVGLVTDLDQHLGARALRCLEAELHHRESVLRAAGASDLPAYLRLPIAASEPLPRLLVVIDEFATVAAELPDFLDALVGIAQRGRSLGVHLVLATQRPSGVVNDNIRANTNLRIALRVQDDADAVDVVGVPDPARIPRDLPGRACVRLGPGEVVPIQTAYAAGHTRPDGPRLEVRPLGSPAAGRASDQRPALDPSADAVEDDASGHASDLDRLVAAARTAAQRGGYPTPRTPWPDPLPEDLPLDTFGPADDDRPAERGALPAVAQVALLDEPDRQRQVPTGWDLEAGNLLVFGIAGSGTTTTLTSIGLALASQVGPDDLHVYALDADRGQLRVLEGLPHVGAVVGAEEGERQRRLVRFLHAEVQRRRASGWSSRPRIVLLIDGYGALAAAYADHADLEVLDALERVIADGAGVGVHVAASAARVGDVPGAVLSGVAQRWVHRLADAYDLSTFGVSPSAVPDMPPGRVLLPATGESAQVARATDPGAAVAAIASAWGPPARRPHELGVLPGHVAPMQTPPAVADGAVWSVPVGIGDADLEPATVDLHPGEHLLVAGPARSGRSSFLLALLHQAQRVGLPVAVVATGRSPLADLDGVERLATGDLAAWHADVTGPTLLLIDDADAVEDPDGALGRLLADREAPVRVVAAGRADALRSAYGHWTSDLRRSRTGVLLSPDADLDGDLLGTRLPRRSPVPARAGAGWLVDPSGARFVQVAQVLAPTG